MRTVPENAPVPSEALDDEPVPTDPAALRALPADRLPALARTLRRRLVQVCAVHGGHLGPNLGAVELTIALHRELDSPREAMIFDTGHQAYVHKMLTGRADLEGLRTAGGVSGYPDRGESEHDVVENSHASGSLAWAHGRDRALRATGRPGVTAAVIGDGALTGGVALEALNDLAGDPASRVLVVLNDNTRSYAPTIGGMSQHLQALSRGEVPPGDDAFTDWGLTYLGPVDGHDLTALAEVLAEARRVAEDPDRGVPVVHALTRKGMGFARAEDDVLDHWHATGPFSLDLEPEADTTPPTAAPTPARTWTSCLGQAVLEAARADERLLAVSAAMIDPVGLTPMQQEMPERVIDVGIAEQAALATAAGLAQGGARPLVALYATFLNRAFDQLLLDIALHGEDVTITLDRAGITGDDGPSHHGMWDLGVAAQIPGLSLWAPRDGMRLAEAVPAALATPGPSIVRFPKGACPPDLPALARIPAGDVLAGDAPAEGDAQGPDVVLVSIGALADQVVEAAQTLSDLGNVLVVDPLAILPVPTALRDLALRSGAVVTIEDGVASRGVGAALAQEILAASSRRRPAPPIRTLGVPQTFIPHAKRGAILQQAGLDAAGIARSVRRLLA
ncbi:1-deoxy-D-xylulose-5-phosphate synthase [Brachybacterium sp. EF45031]|uniref:1-deoxy-D-xylulose-5-phosphate synthase n=1 Tax=Brachybacterium sillae TaxID=2810536 RepID=UPI00217E474D|nr:1-deoxy-D-xylulose-5-phosphate synthase [Brachybacterium sillae]MCS6710524.1 1-deoxy-D-xylulose-5-phosphate synthase [Brachybacterium sillae]